MERCRCVGGGRRPLPVVTRPGPRGPGSHVAAVRRACRRRRRRSPRCGTQPPGQGRPVPAQRSGVPRVDARRLQGGPGAGQHELSLRRQRAALPVDQQRRGGGGVRRRVHRGRRAPPRVAASVRLWLRVGGTGDDPEWALSYEALAASRPSHRRAGANRRSPSSSPDDPDSTNKPSSTTAPDASPATSNPARSCSPTPSRATPPARSSNGCFVTSSPSVPRNEHARPSSGGDRLGAVTSPWARSAMYVARGGRGMSGCCRVAVQLPVPSLNNPRIAMRQRCPHLQSRRVTHTGPRPMPGSREGDRR